jgi:hypothetical protein
MVDIKNDTSPEMPWWVRAITFFGVPSTICLYLVYLLASTIATATLDNSTALIKHTLDTSTLVNAINTEHADHKLDNVIIQQILQAMCVNGSTNADERANCFMAGR